MSLSLYQRHCRVWLFVALYVMSVVALAAEEHNPVRMVQAEAAADTARVIVKFKEHSALLREHALASTATARQTADAVTARAQSLGERLGTILRGGRALGIQSQVVHANGISGAALAKRLAAQTDVEYAVVDQRRSHFALPNDPLFAQGPPIAGSTGGPTVGQWYLRAPGGDIVSSINATAAWDLVSASPNIVVAVLDTGVRSEHPDLSNRVLAGYDMVSDALSANDGGGRDTDASDPGDWITARESASTSSQFYQCGAEDSSWHGTKTSSLIGAVSNNGVGMAGVASGVKLLPVRVLGKCGGYDSDIIAGMRWAAGLAVPGVPANPTPARVISMSLGSVGTCHQSYIDAVNAILSKPNPAVIVASAGNSSGHAVSAPANCPGVIGVAALRQVGTKVGFSDMGPEITISAPGGNCVNTDAAAPCLYPMLAATNTGLTRPVASTYTDSFNASVGTSFSAPLVAGAVALMLSVQPSLTPAEVATMLKRSARAFPLVPASSVVPMCVPPGTADQLECHCTISTCGAGMLDVAAAVASAIAGVTPLTFNFDSGWNLLGNSATQAIDVTTTFGNAAMVDSVWKWNPASARWAFYSPSMQAQALADYTATLGYEVLTTLSGGEGFWLKAKQAFSASVPASPTVDSGSVSTALQPGWNLVTTASSQSPMVLNANWGGVSSLWAWDNASSRWYFYAPSLDIGSALSDYIKANGYLDFSSQGKALGSGAGFWVNRP